MQLPQARTTNLIEQEINKELLIYDLSANKAYNLNETSKTVFRMCDGITNFDTLKEKYNYTDDLIYLTLDELKKSNLIEGETGNHFSGMTRRDVVRRVGLATMIALPIITGIIAPKAANAQSRGNAADDFCVEVECPYAQTQCKADGVCDPATGECLEPNRPDGTPCDDGNAGTTLDTCKNGVCVGGCLSGTTLCGTGATASCEDLQTDPNNCGACGNVCSGFERCINSRCIDTRV